MVWRKGKRTVLAQISTKREVKIYSRILLTKEEKAEIHAVALCDDPYLSKANDEYLFDIPPIFLTSSDALDRAKQVCHNKMTYRGQMYQWYDNSWIRQDKIK